MSGREACWKGSCASVLGGCIGFRHHLAERYSKDPRRKPTEELDERSYRASQSSVKSLDEIRYRVVVGLQTSSGPPKPARFDQSRAECVANRGARTLL